MQISIRTKNNFQMLLLLFVLLVALTIIFYKIKLVEVDSVFLSISTFLFALFSGFFISRQANRYSELRKAISDFDGDMSSLYRAFYHFGEDAQSKMAEILREHYNNILKYGWDYPLNNKTNTLSKTNELLKELTENNELTGIKNAAASRILFVLSGAQRARKDMASLYNERVPFAQFVLIYILAAVLVLVVIFLDSSQHIIASLVKAAFIVAIIMVIILLHRLDKLQLFDEKVGEQTAKDVLDIIDGKK